MGQAEKYKKIKKIFAALVLATAMTNGLEIKYYRRAPVAVVGKQYWQNEGNVQDFQGNIPLNLETQISSQIEHERDRQNTNQRRSSLALIGRTDLMNEDHSVNIASMLTSLKCPSLKISLDLLSSHNCERLSMQRCIADKCRKQIEKLSIQQPFYVDEPRWVEIELDYADKLPYNFNKEDPFFVTRGKKILKAIRTKIDGMSNDDNDDREKLLDNVMRSTGSNDVNQDDGRGKRNGSKRKEERRKDLQLSNRQLEDLMKHLDPINDPFFLTRGKKDFLDDLETETVGRKSHEETKRSIKIESKQSQSNKSVEITNANTNSTLRDDDNVTLPESKVTVQVSSRKKRNSCTDFDCIIDTSERIIPWINDLKKTVSDLSYVQRRYKHSDFSDIFNEPFFISRGKKTLKNVNPESRSSSIDSLSSLEAAKRVLRRLVDSRRCNSKACKELDKFISGTHETMRDRRSSIDDLFKKYDPFYVARGKKMHSSNYFVEDQQRSRLSQQDERYSKNRVSYDFRSFGKR